jgi:hypothetical protein
VGVLLLSRALLLGSLSGSLAKMMIPLTIVNTEYRLTPEGKALIERHPRRFIGARHALPRASGPAPLAQAPQAVGTRVLSLSESTLGRQNGRRRRSTRQQQTARKSC